MLDRGRGRGTRAGRRGGRSAAGRPSGRLPPGRGEVFLRLVHRATADMLDEDLLEARLRDLEARDASAAVERSAQDRLGVAVRWHAQLDIVLALSGDVDA